MPDEPMNSPTPWRRFRKGLHRFGQTTAGQMLRCLFVSSHVGIFLTWLSFFGLWGSYSDMLDNTTPVLPKEALDWHEGVLLDYKSPFRSPCSSYSILVRADDGSERRWFGCLRGKEEYRALIGQRIRFLTQYRPHTYAAIPFYVEYRDEVLHVETMDGQVLTDYDHMSIVKNRLPGGISWKITYFTFYFAVITGIGALVWCIGQCLQGRMISTTRQGGNKHDSDQ